MMTPTGVTGLEGGNCTWTMLTLPPIISDCCDRLEKRGFDDEGIFRVTGSFRDINAFIEQYRQGDPSIDLDSASSYSVAGILTHYFTDSEEPIFPFEIYDLCIECMELDPESLKFECIRHMMDLLPIGNYKIIARFLHVMYECQKLSEINKMTPLNLAIAMTPTMLRPREETIETLIAHSDALTKLVDLLISNYSSLVLKPAEDNLPETVPDTFVTVYNKAKEDLAKRLPSGWMEQHSRKAQQQNGIPEEEKPIAKVQALWRGYALRKRLRNIHFAYQTAYNRAAWDFIRRESNFVHAMKRAIRDFETKLGDNKAGKRIKSLKALSNQNSMVNLFTKNAEAEVKSMVYGFKMLIETHNMLYEALVASWDRSWPAVKQIGEIFASKINMFVVYSTFMDMYCRVDALIHSKEPNSELVKWMNLRAGSSHCSRTLDELLTLPFQHIIGCRVPMQQFLHCVLTHQMATAKNTAEDIQAFTDDKNNMVRAYALFSRLGTAVSCLQRRLNFQRTLALEDSLLGYQNLCLAELNRTLIRKGPVIIEKQPFFVFLFDDICLVTTATKDTYIYNFHIDMKTATIEDNTRLGFLLKTNQAIGGGGGAPLPTTSYQFSTKKAEDKVGLFVAFQTVVDRWHTDRFGVPLEDLLRRENQPEGIPSVVTYLTDYLQTLGKNKQFFVLGGDTYSVTALRNLLNSAPQLSDVDLSKYLPELVVDVLRMFFLELPTPLLNKADFEGIFTAKDEKDINLVAFYNVIQSLPASSIRLLAHISKILSETYLHPSILAQTWGDALYRNITQTVNAALQINGVTTIVRDLLLYYQDLCNPEFDPQKFYNEGEEPLMEWEVDGHFSDEEVTVETIVRNRSSSRELRKIVSSPMMVKQKLGSSTENLHAHLTPNLMRGPSQEEW